MGLWVMTGSFILGVALGVFTLAHREFPQWLKYTLFGVGVAFIAFAIILW